MLVLSFSRFQRAKLLPSIRTLRTSKGNKPLSQPEMVQIDPPCLIEHRGCFMSQLQYVEEQRAIGRNYYQPTWMTHENMTTAEKVQKLKSCSNLLKPFFLQQQITYNSTFIPKRDEMDDGNRRKGERPNPPS
mmetsp:Transcript_15924/g.32695  ORF Transcript_15924/g.32695 Transcript_15924/m.32695 type:complete len:132 (-) Transcript_15924:12-407(-)